MTEKGDVCGAAVTVIDSHHDLDGRAQARGIVDAQEGMVTFDEREVKETVVGVAARVIAERDVVRGRHPYDGEVEIEHREVVCRTEGEANEVSVVPSGLFLRPNERSIPVDDVDVPAPCTLPLASPVPVLA